MKLIRKVKALEVKRCFVVSDYLSHQKYLKKPMATMDKKEYLKRLAKAKSIILELPEMMLDMIIKGEFPKRLREYKKVEWYEGVVNTNEIGVWKRSGGLPLAWTIGSLEQTGRLVTQALKDNSKKLNQRSKTAIPGILRTSISIIQNDKYLLPIIMPGGTMGRKGLKKMKGDIDDGCMRSIALAVSGRKKLKVYIGKKK